MIVKQRYQAVSSRMLFNIAGGAAIVLTGIFVAKWSFTPEDTPSCEQRYERGVRFSLARPSGDTLSKTALRQRFAANDWGSANMEVVATGEASQPHALEVRFAAGSPDGTGEQSRNGGVGFLWDSSSLARTVSACLSYGVWVPKDFKFGNGGRLPGIEGGIPGRTDLPDLEGAKPFGIRMVWRADGSLLIRPQAQNGTRPNLVAIDPRVAPLGLGRWTRIVQEVVLNTPQNPDGILRVWVNGKLKLERTDMPWRGNTAQRWLGVAGDTHYVRAGQQWVPAPRATAVRLTPFELRVQ